MDNHETLVSGNDEPQHDWGAHDRWTTAYDILSSRRRRAVVSLLEQASEPMSTEALTDALVLLESGHADDATEIDPSERATAHGPSLENHREIVACSLHHVHLPMLAEAGVIEWDVDQGVVRLREQSTATVCTTLVRRTPPAGLCGSPT